MNGQIESGFVESRKSLWTTAYGKLLFSGAGSIIAGDPDKLEGFMAYPSKFVKQIDSALYAAIIIINNNNL
jgi:hypothetical protein